MSTTFLVVPQWQGSGSARAMRLVDGAEAIRGDLPSAATTVVDVPLEAGDAMGTGVARAGSLRLTRERSLLALAETSGSVITIGGDCGVSLASVEHANRRTGGELAVVWFDAHPDLNSIASSPSGAFAGMVLRALIGDGIPGLVPELPVDPSRVVVAGARSIDEGEAEVLAERGLVHLGVEDLQSPAALIESLEAIGADEVYLHIDLDVLDPAEFSGLGDPVPFGITVPQLTELVRAVRARFSLAGASITAFAPSSPEAAADDLPTVLRIIGSLTA